MRSIIEVRNIKIGEGIPKICVPIVEISKMGIIEKAKEIKDVGADLVEWRGDYFKYIKHWDEVKSTLDDLRCILEDTPLLFTFRTLKEGGKLDISVRNYIDMNKKIIKTGLVDLLDVELFLGKDIVKGIVKEAQENKVKVIISNHDFHKTPDKNEIISRLCSMQDLGGDILKIAVMPESQRDVLTLLEATEEMVRVHAYRPIITMAMSDLGIVSRITGEVFGSSITFGALGEGSAPGQIPVEQLRNILNIFHR